MKVFILEDDQNRMKQFYKKLKNYEIIHSDNVENAKEKYSDDIKIFFLDHDLNTPLEGNGYQFAKFLAKQKDIHKKEIYIHSMNIIGAQNIKRVLPKAIIIPFSALINSIEG